VLLYTELEEMWWVHNTIVWSLKYETTFKMLQYNRLDWFNCYIMLIELFI